MSYSVELETRALQEFSKLPKEIQRWLSLVFDDLTKNPRPPGSKKLTGQEGYRLRKGDYRVLYIINDAEKKVRVYRIGHRREVYR